MDRDAHLISEARDDRRRKTLEDFGKTLYKLERGGVPHQKRYLRRDWRSQIAKAHKAWKDDPTDFAFDVGDSRTILRLKTEETARQFVDKFKEATGIELSIVWWSTQPGDEDEGGYV